MQPCQMNDGLQEKPIWMELKEKHVLQGKEVLFGLVNVS